MKGIDAAFTARLGRDAERRATKAGQPMAVLTVAVDEGEGEGEGEAGPAPTWAKVLAFGDQAETAAELTKGAEVYVEGRLRFEHWTDKEGAARTGLTVLARLVQPLGRIGRRRRPATARHGPPQRPQVTHQAPAPADDPEPFNDPLPF
jgi:single-strand DNA-binding protein